MRTWIRISRNTVRPEFRKILDEEVFSKLEAFANDLKKISLLLETTSETTKFLKDASLLDPDLLQRSLKDHSPTMEGFKTLLKWKAYKRAVEHRERRDVAEHIMRTLLESVGAFK